MSTSRICLSTLTLLALAALAGCSKSSTAPAMGTMAVHLTDDPAAYDAINLVVTEVSAHLAGAEAVPDTDSDGIVDSDAGDDGGWTVLSRDTVTYDLLALRNGVFTTIGLARIPAGHYTQIRLKLGHGSNLVVGGTPHPLVVPSGLQTGLKLIGSFDVPPGGLLDVALDFDASRSVILTGGGTYMLKPTVKVMTFSTAGAIRGKVLAAGTTSVFAIQAADTLGTATTAADSTFIISVLPAGTYSVAFHPSGAYKDTTITGVAVTAGHTTDVGDVPLSPQ